jgi:hypothetical protein
MDKSLISRLFGHFYTEVNPEMIPNLSRRAVSEGLGCLRVSTGPLRQPRPSDLDGQPRQVGLFMDFFLSITS